MTKTALISSFFFIFLSDGKPNGGEVLSLANSHPRANFDRSHDRFAKKINFGPIFREIFFPLCFGFNISSTRQKIGENISPI